MAFLDRPSWYATPVLTRSNLRRYLWSFSGLFAISLVIGAISSFLARRADEDPLQAFLLGLFGFSSIVLLIVSFFLATFFFFRMFVNLLAVRRNHSEGFRYWSLQHFYKPFYGFRDVDLNDQGRLHRDLAVDGILGYLGTFLVVGIVMAFAHFAGFNEFAS